MLELLLAVTAGMLTIAAPCILLPLPIIFGSSVGQQSRTRPLFITLGFVLTFALLGLSLNYLIQHLGLSANALRNGAALLLGLCAIFMIWPTPFERLMAHFSGVISGIANVRQRVGTGNLGGLLIGVIIGVVWTPCAGPILGSILTLVAQEQDSIRASILLVAYAIGAGIPMLAIAYGGQALTTRIKFVARYAKQLQQVFGVIMLLVAIAIYFQYDTLIQATLLQVLPGINPSL